MMQRDQSVQHVRSGRVVECPLECRRKGSEDGCRGGLDVHGVRCRRNGGT